MNTNRNITRLIQLMMNRNRTHSSQSMSYADDPDPALLSRMQTFGTSVHTQNTEWVLSLKIPNIVLLAVEQRMYHVAKQAIW